MFSNVSFFSLVIVFLEILPICINNGSSAQQAVPDDLQNKTLEELVEHIKSSSSEETSIYEEVLLIYPDIDINIAKKYYELGHFFYNKEAYKKSKEYLDRTILISKKLNKDTLLSKAYSLKGHVYLREGDNQNALESYYSAIEISKRTKDIDRELITKSGLIVVLTRMNQLDKGLEVSRYMLKNIDKSSFVNKINHVRIYTTINEVYLGKEMYDSVFYYANEGIRMSKSLDFKEGLLDSYIKKGMVFYYKKSYDQALSYLLKSEHILDTGAVKNKFFPMVNTCYFISSSYYQQKKYDKAIAYARKIIDQLENKNTNKVPVIQLHLLLANCYRAKKDYKQALFWNDEYVRLNKYYQKNKDKTVNRIYQNEADTMETEISTLKKQIKKEDIIKNTVGIVLGLLLMIVVFVYFKKQKTNKIIFNDLINKIDELESKEIVQKVAAKMINIDDQKVNDVLKRLEKLEKQEYFLKSECNLRSVAKKVKTNSTYLTKIIHIHKDKNFNDYLTDLRIEYVLKRLKDDKKFRSFSIKSIAKEIGYKSDNSFNKHFKAKTGLNPSYYVKNIEKLETIS
ncbi:AraC family transcriptional regulator [Aquimarina sp. 2201CG14-23]|uniref:AraC family transcriptional regulator n=1 Tax=Aquimarina mycalae TaxID=3040073 RepID=UPI0024780508|nr:AraC family transcriptional regulator [Aquimarina sp. 2201CG14-23]MDH7447397.1 helix-turn-helix domain-containing protein [Aquimarina sp. 2201CG14-23]